MISFSPEEMQSIANELNYFFFICDASLTDWRNLSIPFLRLLKISDDEIRENPEIWKSRVSCSDEALSGILKGLSEKQDSLSLKIPFHENNGNEVELKLRLSSLIELSNGEQCRLGSVEIESEDYRYKQEALKARDNEIEISARIQRILLTGSANNEISDLEIAAETLPSRDVDGDFYEFLNLAPHLSDFIIGDVMGKGVPAALLAAAIKASYYKSIITSGITGGSVPDIKTILLNMDSLINRNLMELKKFLTLYYCRLNTEDSILSFIDAGHTSFIYYDSAEGISWNVKGSNMPIGFTSAQEFKTYMLPFDRDDMLFFYSDGISEVKNSEGIMFGDERIRQLINAHSYLSAEDLLKKVLNVTFFFAAETFDDDVTGVAIRIREKRCEPVISRAREITPEGKSELDELRIDFADDLENAYSDDRQEDCARLTIALIEACVNCVSYTESRITVKWNIYTSRTEIGIIFSGPDYNWYQIHSPSVEDYQKSGYGLYLIDRGTDSSLLLKGKDNQKKLVLVKEFL